jgi:lysozyme
MNWLTRVLNELITKIVKKETTVSSSEVNQLPRPSEPVEIYIEPRNPEPISDGLMHMSLDGKIELIGHEGICLQLYLDSVGVRTIGAGATVTEIPNINSLPWSYTITMKEALELFDKSLAKYENAVRKALNKPVKQTQFDALVSWAYNVGVGWAPKATVIKLLNQGVTDKTRLRNALMQYNKPPEIKGRRAKEAKLLTDGVYSNGGKALVFPVNPKTHKPIYNKGKQVTVKELL